jgi:hypothetical protein
VGHFYNLKPAFLKKFFDKAPENFGLVHGPQRNQGSKFFRTHYGSQFSESTYDPTYADAVTVSAPPKPTPIPYRRYATRDYMGYDGVTQKTKILTKTVLILNRGIEILARRSNFLPS